jgi:hypothetical protein
VGWGGVGRGRSSSRKRRRRRYRPALERIGACSKPSSACMASSHSARHRRSCPTCWGKAGPTSGRRLLAVCTCLLGVLDAAQDGSPVLDGAATCSKSLAVAAVTCTLSPLQLPTATFTFPTAQLRSSGATPSVTFFTPDLQVGVDGWEGGRGWGRGWGRVKIAWCRVDDGGVEHPQFTSVREVCVGASATCRGAQAASACATSESLSVDRRRGGGGRCST